MSTPAPAAPQHGSTSFLSRMTPRNWINVAVVLLAVASVVAQRYGFEPLNDYGFSASHARDIALAFAVGAFWPGSPVGHVLDYVAARMSGDENAKPPSDADMGAVRDIVYPPTQPPVRVTSSGGAVAPRLLHSVALVILSGALALGGVSMFMHGCGGSQLRTQGVAADIAGATLDTACQEMDAQRQREISAAAEREHPELGTSEVATVRAHYAPAVASCNLIADAHDAWVAELQRAVQAKLDGRPYTLDISLAARVLASWPDVQAALDSVGVHLGDPDKALVEYAPVSGPQSDLDAGIDGGAQ